MGSSRFTPAWQSQLFADETRRAGTLLPCERAYSPTTASARFLSHGSAKPQVIREGDMPANVIAISNAMTLQNKGGQIVGIDEKVGVSLLYEELGVPDYQDVLDEQYPEKPNGVKGTPGYTPAYDPNRTKQLLAPPVPKAVPTPGGPQTPGGVNQAPGQNTPAPTAPVRVVTPGGPPPDSAACGVWVSVS